MSEGLWGFIGSIIGSVLTIAATLCLYCRQEKERQKTIIAVIDAKLSFWLREFLCVENGTDSYGKGLFLTEIMFKDKTYKDIPNIKQLLKEASKEPELDKYFEDAKRSLDKMPLDHLQMYLENLIKDDFLARDYDCVFLGKTFIVSKIELRSCCECVLLFLCSDSAKQKDMQELLIWNVLRGIYLFEKLRKLIKDKASE